MIENKIKNERIKLTKIRREYYRKSICVELFFDDENIDLNLIDKSDLNEIYENFIDEAIIKEKEIKIFFKEDIKKEQAENIANDIYIYIYKNQLEYVIKKKSRFIYFMEDELLSCRTIPNHRGEYDIKVEWKKDSFFRNAPNRERTEMLERILCNKYLLYTEPSVWYFGTDDYSMINRCIEDFKKSYYGKLKD